MTKHKLPNRCLVSGHILTRCRDVLGWQRRSNELKQLLANRAKVTKHWPIDKIANINFTKNTINITNNDGGDYNCVGKQRRGTFVGYIVRGNLIDGAHNIWATIFGPHPCWERAVLSRHHHKATAIALYRAPLVERMTRVNRFNSPVPDHEYLGRICVTCPQLTLASSRR